MKISFKNREYLIRKILCPALLGIAFSFLFWPMGSARADLANCPIPPNPGQCICHNFEHVQDEICPSGSGIVNGHDAHIACFDAGGVDCSVEDRCGKCNGCGDGIIDAPGEECDDGNNLSGDGCSADCKIECKTDQDCDDGKFCDGTETCGVDHLCHAGTDPCAGGGECNNVCDEVNNNCHVAEGTACSTDNNVCTDDVCNGSGSCVHNPNTAPCDDGNACTLGDTCAGGACVPGGPKDCSDGIECTTDTCDPADGTCTNNSAGCECQSDSDCDDQNPCTDDACNGDHQCTHSNNTNSCDDGIFCNGTDTCSEGTCQHSGDPCSGECNNSCNEKNKSCLVAEGTACSSDNNVCTDDVCNGDGQCVHNANVADCSDGNACTINDVCANSQCGSGSPTSCDDHNSCTDDSCNAQSGCVNVDNGSCGGAVIPNPPPPAFVEGSGPTGGCSLVTGAGAAGSQAGLGLLVFSMMVIPLVRISKLGVWGKNRK